MARTTRLVSGVTGQDWRMFLRCTHSDEWLKPDGTLGDRAGAKAAPDTYDFTSTDADSIGEYEFTLPTLNIDDDRTFLATFHLLPGALSTIVLPADQFKVFRSHDRQNLYEVTECAEFGWYHSQLLSSPISPNNSVRAQLVASTTTLESLTVPDGVESYYAIATDHMFTGTEILIAAGMTLVSDDAKVTVTSGPTINTGVIVKGGVSYRANTTIAFTLTAAVDAAVGTVTLTWTYDTDAGNHRTVSLLVPKIASL